VSEDRARRILALAQLSSTVGDGLFYVCSALYFTRIVGLSPVELGLGLTIAWTLGLVAGVPLGHLADRRGPRGIAILLCGLAAAATTAFMVVQSVVPFIMAASVYAVCSRGAQTAQQALLAGLVDRTRITLIRAFIISRLNIGLAVGAAAGGLVLTIDTSAAYLTAFAVDGCSFLIAAFLLSRLPAPAPAHAASSLPLLTVFRDRPYVIVSLVNLVLVLHLPLIDVALPLWILNHTDAPRWMVSVVFVLNTVVVVTCQVRMARSITGMASAVRSVRFAGAFLLAACGVYAASSIGSSAWLASALLITAAALMTVGEMRQTAGTSEISFGLAPVGSYGQYQGFFGMGLTAAEAIGPLLLTGMLIYGGATGWLVLGALFLAASLAMGPAVRAAERSIASRPPVAPANGPSPRPAHALAQEGS
jgi:hypothetical protein